VLGREPPPEPKELKRPKAQRAKPQGVTKTKKPTRVARGKAPAMEEEAGAKAKGGREKKVEVKIVGGRRKLAEEREVNWKHDGSRIDDPDELPDKWDPNEYDLDEKLVTQVLYFYFFSVTN
jgi:hypothetical protein